MKKTRAEKIEISSCLFGTAHSRHFDYSPPSGRISPFPGPFFTTNPFNSSGQGRLEIDFWTRSRNGEEGESYLVKYFDGTSYQTISTCVQGTDDVHNEIQNRTVVIDISDYIMSPEARTLFEASGSGNSDDFYFDQIHASGFSTVPEPGMTLLLMSGAEKTA